jgi:hypothetical protein
MEIVYPRQKKKLFTKNWQGKERLNSAERHLNLNHFHAVDHKSARKSLHVYI